MQQTVIDKNRGGPGMASIPVLNTRL